MVSPVSVNTSVCTKIAERLTTARLREEFYARPFLNIKGSVETRLRGYFYSVAICHQTYALRNEDLNLYGWDYLEYVFTLLMASGDNFLAPGSIASSSAEETETKLGSLFPFNLKNQSSSLFQLSERAALLKELDTFLSEHYHGELVLLLAECENHLLKSGKGYYEVLAGITAFSDPMRKKSTFLAKLLEEAGMLTIADPENFIPIMDYHMQRVLMRLGCVEIHDSKLKNALMNRSPLPDDEVVRSACIEAFKMIADLSGVYVTKLNDYFWSLGRSCCNEKPLCEFHLCEKDPCTFEQIIRLEEHKDCFFRNECKGYTDTEYRRLWQPVVETHYY